MSAQANSGLRLSDRPRPDDPVVLWRDVFAVFDDGSYAVRDYASVERRLFEQQTNFPHGLGCLVVIPTGAKRIQDDVRAEIERVLNAISVRALCWTVLEGGFRGATIRGTLTTLNMLGRRKNYPTRITGGLEEALEWLLPRLDQGASRLRDMDDALAVFRERLSPVG